MNNNKLRKEIRKILEHKFDHIFNDLIKDPAAKTPETPETPEEKEVREKKEAKAKADREQAALEALDPYKGVFDPINYRTPKK